VSRGVSQARFLDSGEDASARNDNTYWVRVAILPDQACSDAFVARRRIQGATTGPPGSDRTHLDLSAGVSYNPVDVAVACHVPGIRKHGRKAIGKEEHVSSEKSGTRRPVLAVMLAGVWVNLCEVVRNQVLLLPYWQAHYRDMGLVFPAQPVNAMLWMGWAFLLAGMAFAISRRFGLWQTTLLVWVMGFVMMWVVIWNLSVLPAGVLPIAVPFTLIEALGAAFICRRLARPGTP